MIENQIRDTCPNNKPDDKAGEQAVERQQKRFALQWEFWNNHAASYWGALIGGLMLTPLLDWPDMKPRHVYIVGAGIWIIVGTIIWFFCHSVAHHMTDTSERDAAIKERAEHEFKSNVQKQLDRHSADLSRVESEITSLRTFRPLTVIQRAVISEFLSKFAGQKASVCGFLIDAGVNQSARDYSSVLRDANWILPEKLVAAPMESRFLDTHTAVFVGTINDGDPLPDCAVALKRVLATLGLCKNDGRIYLRDDLPGDEVRLWVGPRIPPILSSSPPQPPPQTPPAATS